jgi:hypothetical protein
MDAKLRVFGLQYETTIAVPRVRTRYERVLSPLALCRRRGNIWHDGSRRQLEDCVMHQFVTANIIWQM